jgi:hypothetical protein
MGLLAINFQDVLLLRSFFHPEDGGDIVMRNVR